MLEQHRAESTKVWQELIANGFGGSLSGQKFSSKHGDLIIVTTINREVKVRGGPMQGGSAQILMLLIPSLKLVMLLQSYAL